MAAWIKMRGNLWDDPRVAAIVDATDTSEATTIGALYWLWATADDHTEDGMLTGMTARQIDRKTGIQGFAAAVASIGWIEISAEGVLIIRFDEHNGASAKRRASESRRKVSARDADKVRTDGGKNAHLEEEREEEEQEQSSTAAPLTADGLPDGQGEAGRRQSTAAERAAARAARLAQVSRDAIETFNDSKLTKANGGMVPNVDPDIGADKRQKQVSKSLSIARGICRKDFDSELIVRDFWVEYWELCLKDDHKSGRVGGGKDHGSWVPTFEYLTREATMLEIYDRAVSESVGGDQ